MSPRPDGRAPGQLRPVAYELGYQEWAAGSVLFSMGKTRVLCAASRRRRSPPVAPRHGQGWVTGEYSMLPASTTERSPREVNRGRPGGRTQEIQRLIGRSLRAVTDLAGSASGRSRSTATSCRPTPAPGRPRSPAATSRSRSRSRAGERGPRPGRPPDGHRGGGLGGDHRGRGPARPVLRGGCRGRGRLQRRDDGLGLARRGPGERRRASRSTAPRSTQLLDLASAGIAELTKIQRDALDA